MSPQVLISLTMAWYEEFLQSSQAVKICSTSHPSSVQKKWVPPIENVVKLNIDGSFVSSINYGGIRRIIRDHTGSFIAGFSYRKTCISSPLHIELLAIKGLLFLQAL
jgi:hypothetical protein